MTGGTDHSESYPPDVEPLPDEHEFFVELCELVEKYDEEMDRSREELLYDVRSFSDFWITQSHMTGLTW